MVDITTIGEKKGCFLLKMEAMASGFSLVFSGLLLIQRKNERFYRIIEMLV